LFLTAWVRSFSIRGEVLFTWVGNFTPR
jgi:hypothetical protein